MLLQDLNDALDKEESGQGNLDESGEAQDEVPGGDGLEFERGVETMHPRNLEYLVANQGIPRSRNRVPRDDDAQDTVATFEDSLEAISQII